MMDLCRNRRDCFLSLRANSSSTTISAERQLPPPPRVIVGKSALFASSCPFSDAKSSAAAGCPSEPRTAPPPSNFRLRTAMEWHIQDGRQLLSKNVPFWSVPSHIFEPNGGIPSHLGLKTSVKKVCYCQNLPSNCVLLGASYSVYWWVQSLQDIQDGVKFIWSHRCSILICHPSTVAKGDTLCSDWAILVLFDNCSDVETGGGTFQTELCCIGLDKKYSWIEQQNCEVLDALP